MQQSMTATEGWLLNRGWVWVNLRGESWQKGDYTFDTAAGARQHEEQVVQFQRRDTPRAA